MKTTEIMYKCMIGFFKAVGAVIGLTLLILLV
jgi:hypothetical protein